jgi:hypothetical protein
MPSIKTINYALSLLKKGGYPVDWMNAQFEHLGANFNQRAGRVEDWLKYLSDKEINHLIEKLRKEGVG